MLLLPEPFRRRASRASGVRLGCAAALVLVLGATIGGCQRIPTADYGDGGDGLGTDEPDQPPGGSNQPVYNCDPVDQNDCDPGQKCTPLDKYGKQNYYECVEDDGEIDIFEGCTPDKDTGQDGCRARGVCLADYTEAGGICVELCKEDKDCTAGLCINDPEMDVPYCADECLPFGGGCPGILQCRRDRHHTVCQFATDVDTGTSGDECGDGIGDRGCRERFACLAGAVVTGCQSLRCCAEFCDLNSEEPECSDPDSCNPAFDNPAPTAENVGACYVPA
jgi:hypothetical protein